MASEFAGLNWKKELGTISLSRAHRELTLTVRMANWYKLHRVALVCYYCKKDLAVGDRLFTGGKTSTRSFLLLSHKACRDKLYM